MLTPRKELPGDVIIALRQVNGYVRSVSVFADFVGWSYDTLHRMEMVCWGTPPEQWERPVDIADLAPLLNRGLMTRGDEFWMRFQVAFAWQHIVLQYGKQVYDEKILHERFLAPVFDQHAIAVVRALAEQEVATFLDSGTELSDTEKELLTERTISKAVFRLATTGLILTKETKGPIPPGIEQTRALDGIFAGASAEGDPYMNTLRLVLEWAEGDFRQVLEELDSD